MKKKRTCPVCGVTYYAKVYRLKLGRQTTCSRKCSYILRGDNLTNSISFTCSVCGKNFKRSPSQIKGKYNNQFCSRSCQYSARSTGLSKRVCLVPYQITEKGRAAWRQGAEKTRKIRLERNNYGHTEATRAKLSLATSKAIAEGRIKRRSRLEDKVGIYLNSIGLFPVPQYVVRSKDGRFACSFDFLFLDRKIALEVNGTFWHSDPRFFPNGPVYEIQKRNAIKWERKLIIAKFLGIEIREVWEYDLGINLAETVSRIVR